MSERSIRVNELILREVSHILRTRFRDQAVAITISGVSISPDLRNGRIYYSVIGDERAKIKARSLFTKEYKTFQQMVAQKVVLKYFPKLHFIEDTSMERGSRVLDLLGQLDEDSASASAALAEEDNDETVEYVFDEDDLEYARDIAAEDDSDSDEEEWDDEDEGDWDADTDYEEED